MLHYFMCCKYRVIHLPPRNVKYLNYPRNMTARADTMTKGQISQALSSPLSFVAINPLGEQFSVYKNRRCISTSVDDRGPKPHKR
jgi:hypothetical protein